MKAGELLPLVTQVVVAKLSTSKTPSADVAPLIQSVYQMLDELRIKGTPAELPEPTVPIKRSVTPVCLEDGRQLQMLKGHLRRAFDVTPDQYRAALGVASGLSDGRTELCKEAQQNCEGYRPWYATASETRKGVGPGTSRATILLSE
jgi:hypothetical protein